MKTILELISAARRSGDCGPLTAIIPFAGWMGITMEIVDDHLRGHLAYSDMLVGNPTIPALHGGTLGALLESTAIFEILWASESIVLPKTINLSIDYVRSAKAEDVHARGIITKLGRRVANVRAEAWQRDPEKPVAIAHAHFLLGSPAAKGS